VNSPADPIQKCFAPGRFALLAGLLIIACFPRVLTGSETFFFRDFAIFSYPLAAHHREVFWEGGFPLWNPYNNCGLPFLAQWNTMVLYPLSFIYLLFPLPWSLNLFCLLHLFLAALGMYFLARVWTRDNFAAAIAGLAFIFGGVVLSCLKWPNNIAALGWMPWVALCVERALAGDRTPWRSLGIAGLVGATQMLSGAPEIILLTWVFCAARALDEFAFGKPRRFAVLLRFGLAAMLTAGLSAAQLLPFLDLLQHSQRDENFAGAVWPMPYWGWLNFLVPAFRALASYHGVLAQPLQFWISTYYISLCAVLLGIFALAKIRERRVWLLAALILLVMWLALGPWAGLYSWLLAILPGMGLMRFPIKFVVLAAFLAPLLAALGLARLKATPLKPDWLKPLIIPALVLWAGVAAILAYSELSPFRYSPPFVTARGALGRLGFLTAGTILLALFCISRPVWKARLAGAFALIVALDGLTHAPWQNPTAPSWVYDGSVAQLQPKPALGQARAMLSPEASEEVDHLMLDTPAQDVMASRASLYANINLLERIPKIDGFYALYPREMAELQKALYASTNLPSEGLLDFLGASQITKPRSWNEWVPRPSALPLITSPSTAIATNDTLAAVLDPAFDPRRNAYLTATPADAITASASIAEINWQPARISFQASADKPAIVVLSQTFHHRWRATVEGQPAPILRANHAFQAIEIPSGQHTVMLEYRDSSFRFGSVLSVLFACAVLLMVLQTPSTARPPAPAR